MDGHTFVTEYNPIGNQSLTNIISSSNTISVYGMGIDLNRTIYLTGKDYSSDFPVKNAFQESFGGGSSDAFIIKFNLQKLNISSSTISTSSGTITNGIILL